MSDLVVALRHGLLGASHARGASRSCGILALAVEGALGSVVTPRAGFVIVGVVGLVIAVVSSAMTWRRLR